MPKYAVTVEFSGTKTYEIEAGHPDQVEFLFEQWSTFDSHDNPIDDSVSETILRIEEIPEPEELTELEETLVITSSRELIDVLRDHQDKVLASNVIFHIKDGVLQISSQG